MKIISVNAGKAKTVRWSGKNYRTGIFKAPIDGNIFLGETDVVGDQVIDRRYHGGVDKACYAFSFDEYDFWQSKYPNLTFTCGMFGENLTIAGLDERAIHIGDTFEVGSAIIQVAEPRQPCVKLNIRFESKLMMKQFIQRERCGIYFRVIQPGSVKAGDELNLVRTGTLQISVQEVFNLLYGKGDKEKALALQSNEELGSAVRSELEQIFPRSN